MKTYETWYKETQAKKAKPAIPKTKARHMNWEEIWKATGFFTGLMFICGIIEGGVSFILLLSTIVMGIMLFVGFTTWEWLSCRKINKFRRN